MKIFKNEPNFNFMDKRFYAFMLSGLIIIGGVILFFTKSFNLGIDFTGGTMIEVSFKDDMTVADLRDSLKKVGLSKSMIQRIGTESKFFIKTERVFEETDAQEAADDEHQGFTALVQEALMTEEEKQLDASGKLDLNDASEKAIGDFLVQKNIDIEVAAETAGQLIDLTKNTKGLITDFSQVEQLELDNKIMKVLKEDTYLGGFIFLSTESVGPKVGHDLRGKATRAAIYVLIGMLLYIGVRFRFVFGFAAVLTLVHDVLITLTLILLFQVEVNLTVMAAILTILGYSLNDTIVIFDRVRDNLKLMRRDKAENILDRSINQTLSRTVVTSSTTLCPVLALFFFGGEVIHAFSITLLMGIFIGTYSSIFQSCAWLKIWEKSLLGKKKQR